MFSCCLFQVMPFYAGMKMMCAIATASAYLHIDFILIQFIFISSSKQPANETNVVNRQL